MMESPCEGALFFELQSGAGSAGPELFGVGYVRLHDGWIHWTMPPAKSEDFLVDARAFDADGAMIDVILHPAGGILNWGEWCVPAIA